MIEVTRGDGVDPLRYVIQSASDFADAMPSSLKLQGAKVEFRPVHTHVIRNVAEVQEATTAVFKARDQQLERQQQQNEPPSEKDEHLLALAPENLSVSLGECTNMIAEDITVTELPAQIGASAPTTNTKTTVSGGSSLSDADLNDTLLEDDGPHFAVVTRWSGGQGTLESATGRVFFIEDAHSFASFDPNSVAIRGAVVQFEQDPARPRYARGIVILSEVSKSGGVGDSIPAHHDLPLSVINTADFDQALVKHADYSQVDFNVSGAVPGAARVVAAAADANVASASAPTTTPTGSDSDPFAHLPIKYGTVVTYSKHEKTGVIQEVGGAEERFVIRDAGRDVVGFAQKGVEKAFKKGCYVSFVAVGVSGRVAGRVALAKDPRIVDDEDESPVNATAEADDGDKAGATSAAATTGSGAAAEDSDEPRKSLEEATASPMATEYWLRRFERVGANVSEYRKAASDVKPADPDEALDEYANDDPWFKDPKRNKKVRGNATASDMMMISPANLMNLSMKGYQDPAKLQTDANKIEKRLPPEVRMKCRDEAKQWAPKFLKAMQDTRERGGEPSFNFYQK
jgi:hypothetical protein